jgi:competence protein ComEA
MKSWQHTLTGIFIGLILAAAILIIAQSPRGAPVELLPAPTPAPIAIYVRGAVRSPGVYELPQGSRVEAALAAAGGCLDGAGQPALDLAARLKDGETVYVAAPGETALPAASRTIPLSGITPDNLAAGAPVNLNTATLAELQTLPGIGETRASEIVAYRESHGGFQSIEEIQEVPGIGPVMFERLKDRIVVE